MRRTILIGLIGLLFSLLTSPGFAQVSPDPTRGPTVTTASCQPGGPSPGVWTLTPPTGGNTFGGTLCNGQLMAAGAGSVYLWTGGVLYVQSAEFWYRWTGTAWAGYGPVEPPTGTPPPPTTDPIPVTAGVTKVGWSAPEGTTAVDGYHLCVDTVCVAIGKPSPLEVLIPAMTPGLHTLTVDAFNASGSGLPSTPLVVRVSVTVPGPPTNLHPVP